MRRSTMLATAVLLLGTCGCARLASLATGRLMVRAPNQVDPRIRTANRLPIGEPGDRVSQRFWVPVGPPKAELLVSVVEPNHSHLAPRDANTSRGARRLRCENANTSGGARRLRSTKGTVMLLHGAYGRSEQMLPLARTLAAHGFRAVAVDLRGHGRSTGERITYGVQESADLVQVVDALAARGLVEGGLGVYGFSFGAATGLQLAARDPRVGAVVAAASFSRLQDVVGEVARAKLPGAKQYADARWTTDTLSEASREAEFDVRAADAVAAIERTRAMVLLIHGDADEFVTPRHSLALHRAGWNHSRVVFLRGANHAAVAQDEGGEIAQLAVGWFDRWLPRVDSKQALP